MIHYMQEKKTGLLSLLFTSVFNRSAIILALMLTSGHIVSAENNSCQVIDYSTRINVTGKNLIFETTLLIEISDPSCRNLAHVTIPFRKEEKAELTEACIIDRHGEVRRKIRKSDIEISSDIDHGSFFSDDFKMSFSLYWHEYPYRIRYSYRKEIRNFIYIARWTPCYYPYLPVNSASLTITAPPSYKITFLSRGGLAAGSFLTDEGMTYQWMAKDLPSMENEVLSPALSDLLPQVIASPEEFRYEVSGMLRSWQTYGQWFDDLTQGLDVLTPEEKMITSRLINGISDRREIVRKLYHYLQDNTRYINVSLETGGFKPYPAAYVCKNKYGDCKALSVYMKALLKEAGIESHYVHINAGHAAPVIIREAPGPQFNHMILCVPLDGDTIWLDNTTTSTPLGYLGAGISGKTALIINGPESRLVSTPMLKESDVLNTSEWTFKLDENGNGNAFVKIRVRGDDFHRFAIYRKYLSEDKLGDTIAGFLKLTDAEIKKWTLVQPDRDSGFIMLDCELEVLNQVRRMGKYSVFRTFPLRMPDLETADERETDLLIPYPVSLTDTLLYFIPFRGKYTSELPGALSESSDFGEVRADTRETPMGFMVTRKVIINAGRVDVQKYQSFLDFIGRVDTAIRNTTVILKQK